MGSEMGPAEPHQCFAFSFIGPQLFFSPVTLSREGKLRSELRYFFLIQETKDVATEIDVKLKFNPKAREMTQLMCSLESR